MKNRKVDETKKRIAERRRNANPFQTAWAFVEQDDEEDSLHDVQKSVDNSHNKVPTTRSFASNWFVFRVLISIALVLTVGILYRSQAPSLDSARQWVGQAFATDFQFAKVSDWLASKVGDLSSFAPVDFLKSNNNDNKKAIPVSGKLLESFKKNGEGILVETEANKNVTTINAGVVIFAGEDEVHGKTVVVQQKDMNVWYGNLSDIEVTLYQHLDQNVAVGKVSPGTNGNSGEYYFAIEKDQKYVDPIQVITLE